VGFFSQAKACAYQAYVLGFKVAATFRLRWIFDFYSQAKACGYQIPEMILAG
jgi:hypothetical protein